MIGTVRREDPLAEPEPEQAGAAARRVIMTPQGGQVGQGRQQRIRRRTRSYGATGT